MPKSSKKKPSNIYDFPGLWDIPSEKDQEGATDNTDLLQKMVDRYRSEQYTPKHHLHASQIERQVYRSSVRPTELEFISFGSGSSGNCAYLGIRGMGGILIDAGVDAKRVLDELDTNYIPLEKIKGILITHDHTDHTRFAYPLLRKNPKMALYCTPRTLTGILRKHSVSSRIKDYHKPVFKEFEFQVGDFKITPFEVSHDGSDNVGFSIAIGDKHFVLTGDMGKVSERADYYIRQANYLMIESNYDETLLRISKRPEYLKDRIRKPNGHLDNEVTAAYLAHIWDTHLTHVYLCHLSEETNRPDIALAATTRALQQRGVTVGDGTGSAKALEAQVQVSILPRYDSSPLYILRL